MFWPLIADTNKYQGFCFPRYIFRIFPKGIILMFTAASRLNVLTLFLVRLLLLLVFFFAFVNFWFLSVFLLSFSIIQYLINTWYWIVFLTDIDPIQDGGMGAGREAKKLSYKLFLVTSTNVEICPQNFLTFIFNHFFVKFPGHA